MSHYTPRNYTPTTEEIIDTYYDAPGMQSPRFDGHEFDRWLAKHDAKIRADERERILAPHKEIDADNSCGDPDCCGGPYPMMVCEVCGTDWPCSVVIAARGEDTH